MPPCHPFRPVPGQCGPNRRGPLPAPPFDPRDYWATRKCVSRLSASLGTKLDKADVVDPGAEAETGEAADAKGTYEELSRILAKLAKKADKATTLAGYGITDAATKEEVAAKADLVGGKVPAAQLPSYVDDVLEYDAMSAFPATGESGKIYVAKDTNLTYRWSGTQYVEISPSPVLDDTVTETSSNGVKSSGIWSWVKSLLPHWLTSDYAEPATVASVENKRDKDDLAVYEVVRIENTDWTWASEDAELLSALQSSGVKPMWVGSGQWYVPAAGDFLFADTGYLEYGHETTELYCRFLKEMGDLRSATATRPRYMDEMVTTNVVDRLATTNGVNAAIEAHHDDTKRDKTDNICHKTELAEWSFSSTPQDSIIEEWANSGGVRIDHIESSDTWEAAEVFAPPAGYSSGLPKIIDVSADGLTAYISEAVVRGFTPISFTVTRSAACTDGKKFVTDDVVDGKVSSAVSTNNPAFVSSVQNTPTSGMPEDMPTDWGTYGTVGAALAALAAGLKWCKNILGSLASGYSTFAAWIASKYTKPSGGIPASDLALTVRSSLDAADAAAPQATTYTKDETDAAIRAGASLGQMTNLGNGRYEYTGALADASTQTYPREEA